MKLNLSILSKIIDLPSKDAKEIRTILDEIGLEVKGISNEGGKDIFTIETLANRGDHLYALGMAREISARLMIPVKIPHAVSEIISQPTSVKMDVQSSLCSALGLLEMRFPSDFKLDTEIEALMDSKGDKHPIVDLLNYIQLEIGQPMHAFDKDKIEGAVVICETTKEEEIEALNGKKYVLPVGTLVHKDQKKIIDIAGIMGCANTMVSKATERVIVEAAGFDPVAIRKTARKIGIATEASHAFERGTDVPNIGYALRRLAYLAQGAVKDSTSPQLLGYFYKNFNLSNNRSISVRIQKVREHANIPKLPEVEILQRLKLLGYTITESQNQKEFSVTVPTWRLWDVHDELDVVEDFIYAYGINRVKLSIPNIEPAIPEKNIYDQVRDRIEPVLNSSGFTEVITNGFYSDSDVAALEALSPKISDNHIRLKNSVESSFAAMKCTNIIHLSQVVEANLRRGMISAKVYEFGRIFSRNKLDHEELQHEEEFLTIAMGGRWLNQEWSAAETLNQKLMHFKGSIERLFSTFGYTITTSESHSAFLHPGCRANVKVGTKIYGSFGLLHPTLQTKLGVKNHILYAEFDVAQLANLQHPASYKPQSIYPSIKRDFTIKIGIQQNSSITVKHISALGLDNLATTEIIDEFKKKEEEFRRVTYRLQFQRSDRTLEHDEVNKDTEIILGFLKDKGLELVS